MPTVLVAQSGRAEDCGSLWHGFKSHLTPQYTHLVQWLEHQAYTLGVEGSNPSVSTSWSTRVANGTDCKSDDSWVQIPPPSLSKLL